MKLTHPLQVLSTSNLPLKIPAIQLLSDTRNLLNTPSRNTHEVAQLKID